MAPPKRKLSLDSRPPTISAAGVRAILLAVQYLGIDPEPIRNQAGLAACDLEDCDLRLSCEYAARVFQAARASWSGEGFGLALGLHYQPFMLGITGQLLINAKSALEALRGWMRYQAAFGEGIRLELAEGPAEVEAKLLIHPPLRERAGHDLADSALGAVLTSLHALTGERSSPRAVRLQRPPPRALTAYQSAFGCLPQFAQMVDCVVLSRAELERPLLLANSQLFGLLERELQYALSARVGGGVLADRVRSALQGSFDGHPVTLGAIAQRCGLSPRGLQRRLRAEGLGFQRLLDEARRAFAAHHLRERRVGIEALAYLLGFADARAFRRAFKRWTGSTPGDFRRQPEP